MRLERRTSKGSSSGRIMRLVPVFTLETHNRTNYKCLPKFVQTDNASSSIKTAINKTNCVIHWIVSHPVDCTINLLNDRVLGPVVRKPINANPGFKYNRGFNFSGLKDFRKLILSCMLRKSKPKLKKQKYFGKNSIV